MESMSSTVLGLSSGFRMIRMWAALLELYDVHPGLDATQDIMRLVKKVMAERAELEVEDAGDDVRTIRGVLTAEKSIRDFLPLGVSGEGDE
jgi:hypothetical protein